MATGDGQRPKRWSKADRARIVRLVLDQDWTVAEVAELYQVEPDWLREQLRARGWDGEEHCDEVTF